MRGARGAAHVQQRALGNQRRGHEAVVLVTGLRQLEALGGRERDLLRVRGSAAGHTRQRAARCCAYPRKRAGASARSTAPVLAGRVEGASSARHSVRVCDGRAARAPRPGVRAGRQRAGRAFLFDSASSCSRVASSSSLETAAWEGGQCVSQSACACGGHALNRCGTLSVGFTDSSDAATARRSTRAQHQTRQRADVAEHCRRCGKPPCLAGMHGAGGCAAAARTRVGAHALFMGSVTAKFSCTLCVRSSFFTVCRWISAAAVVSTPCCRPAMAPA